MDSQIRGEIKKKKIKTQKVILFIQFIKANDNRKLVYKLIHCNLESFYREFFFNKPNMTTSSKYGF